MPNDIIAYHGGSKSETPEEGAEQAKWKAWVDGLGDAVVNPGTPLGKSQFVSAPGVSDSGSTLQVAEMKEM